MKNAARSSRPAAKPVRSRRPRTTQEKVAEVAAGVLAMFFLALVGNALQAPGLKLPVTATPTPVVQPVRQVAVPISTFSGGYQKSACTLFSPQHGDRHRVVFVDPGHGGVDRGAAGSTSTGKTVFEKDLALKAGTDLLTLLRNDGYTVILSRTEDTTVMRTSAADFSASGLKSGAAQRDIEARVACANASGAQILLSIHFNSVPDTVVNGTETLYDSARPFSAGSLRLATAVQQSVLARYHAAGWPVPDRGVQPDGTASTATKPHEVAVDGHILELGPAVSGTLNTPSAMPGIFVEPLFISHAAETDVALEVNGARALAAGLKDGIDRYFAGVAAAPTSTT